MVRRGLPGGRAQGSERRTSFGLLPQEPLDLLLETGRHASSRVGL